MILKCWDAYQEDRRCQVHDRQNAIGYGHGSDRRRGRPKSVISRREVTLGRSMEPAKGSRGTMESIPFSSFNGSYPIGKPALHRCKLRGRRRRRPVTTKLDVSRLPLLQPNEIASFFFPRGHQEMSSRSCPFAYPFWAVELKASLGLCAF